MIEFSDCCPCCNVLKDWHCDICGHDELSEEYAPDQPIEDLDGPGFWESFTDDLTVCDCE